MGINLTVVFVGFLLQPTKVKKTYAIIGLQYCKAKIAMQSDMYETYGYKKIFLREIYLQIQVF